MWACRPTTAGGCWRTSPAGAPSWPCRSTTTPTKCCSGCWPPAPPCARRRSVANGTPPSTGGGSLARSLPRMVTTNLDVPARALAVGAHPDDVEFGCGATLAKWPPAGCQIHHLICTDGSKGSWDPDEDTAKLVAVRQDEQRDASRALGGQGEVVFLGWPDGELD